MIKNDSKNRVQNFESMNMVYVVEQQGKAATLEFNNVKLKKVG
ncbi:P2 family phage major capsid protein [Vibrio aestuarianus subsp. francensis]|nr:P2 family phage major capsid protein [Vibrio aestuarianus subsp. francensis]NLS50991.1 P2 family phage major capsid protein [Vibrio aestuarianus subsp. francensis]NLS59344.1 P2 family phage major capsid protein [Vibrio aestuarianus subsp. francensis]NLS66245.1 P2 family phage major capsid protein [Vibrio aestuarianus subsp. francensis]NLS82889.1 P2 family phage major capsid protein [Vibrio aestuarianus subsp. francensis]